MDKLKLNLDDLNVESFETTSESAGRQGTVLGYEEYTLDADGGGCNSFSTNCDAACDDPYYCTDDEVVCLSQKPIDA